MIGGISFFDLAVAEHQVQRAVVRFEDTGTEVDVAEAEDDDHNEGDVVDDLSGKKCGLREMVSPLPAGQKARVEPQDHAGDCCEDACEEQGAVGNTLQGLNFTLRRHVNLAGSEKIRNKAHGESTVVCIPFAEDVVFKEVNKALRRNDDRQKRNQNKRNGEQSVRPAHSDGELAANSIVPGGDHNEQSCDRKQDAGNRYNTVRDSCQNRMALDVFSNHGGPLYSAFSLRSCSAASFLASRRYSSPRLR